jgi:lysozyme family protein
MTDREHKLIWVTIRKNETRPNGDGYINDPSDPGGETNFGISKHSYPNLDIRNLTIEDAINIGFRDYWTPNRLSTFTNDNFAWKCFDLMFNFGVDGWYMLMTGVGLQVPDDTDTDIGVQTLVSESLLRYDEIVAKHPATRKFLTGWDRRAVQTLYTHIPHNQPYTVYI